MTSRGWFMVLVTAGTLAGTGCHHGGGPHVSGSGYGVGLTRRNWMFGKDWAARGSTQGVSAPTERGVGQIIAPPRVAYPQAGRIVTVK
jgi:hypothetical protein